MTTVLERYYGALVGRWRGEVQVRLTDEAAFRAASLTFLDRARLWAMNRADPATIETTLALAPGGAALEFRTEPVDVPAKKNR